MTPEQDTQPLQPVALVTTTINVPTVLDAYSANARRFGHEPMLLVVGDRRTPPQAATWLAALGADGTDVEYLDVHAQRRWLKRFPALDRLLPWNSIQRRNLAYLRAAERGAQTIITVDDDNIPTDADFIGAHGVVGHIRTVETVAAANGWFNVCELLETQPPVPFVPRGFPPAERHAASDLSYGSAARRVVVNAGLWTGDPDVDAATRMVLSPTVSGLRPDTCQRIALASGTWCPFNSQNTAFDATLLPCMYLVVMGATYRGMVIDRHDDVWMSLFAQKIIEQMGDAVTFGEPLVNQVRNNHNVLDDLAGEVPGMLLTDTFVRLVRGLELQETSYVGCYQELIEGLRSGLGRRGACTADERSVLAQVLAGMQVWASACAQVAA